MKVWRDGKELPLEVTVGDLSQAPSTDVPVAQKTEPASTDAGGGLGLTLTLLKPEMREPLGLAGDVTGVLVAAVDPDSVAAERGLQSGDVILRVGRQKVANPDEVVKTVKQAHESGDETVLMLIERDGASRFVALPLTAG